MENHPAKILWELHHPQSGYPSGTLAVPEVIPGRAFFPGGYGLWGAREGKPLPPFPVGGVMVLGRDFHSASGYYASLKERSERSSSPTWRNLIALLDRHGIDAEQCFFTNAYMGLRSSTSATGVFAGAADATFVRHCQHFLLEQLALQKPKLILSLGIHVPPFLATLSSDLVDWGKGIGLRHLDATGPMRSFVSFDGISNYRTTVVALVHPSLRHACVRHRRYCRLVGADAEDSMIMDAIKCAAIRPEGTMLTKAEKNRFSRKMADQIQPGEPDSWKKWMKILDEK